MTVHKGPWSATDGLGCIAGSGRESVSSNRFARTMPTTGSSSPSDAFLPCAPLAALGMAAAMMLWLPLAMLVHYAEKDGRTDE